MEAQEVKLAALDPREEVRKLQEMVRKLELQNEELRIGHHKKNGLIHGDSHKQQAAAAVNFSPNKELRDGRFSSTESLVDVFDDPDLEDEQTWLFCSSKYSGESINLDEWLESELKLLVPSLNRANILSSGHTSNLARRLTQIKKSAEQCQVDTRTFTRPKKQRSGLYPSASSSLAMSAAAIAGPSVPPGHQVLGVYGGFDVDQGEPEDLLGSDEENTVPNGPVSPLPERKHARDSSLPRYRGSPKPSVLEETFRVERSVTPERQGAGSVTLGGGGRLTPREGSGLVLPRSRLEKGFGYRSGSPLNRTFHLDGNRGDGVDEDQMSSASDSSFSSSHRAMTAGEVKDLARMQEESLRYMSTPAWKSNLEGRPTVHQMSSDLPSPITRSSEDFHSDHSEDRSSRSSIIGDSLHSSPAGSPFGSSQALVGVGRTTDGMHGSNETLERPVQPRLNPNKQRVEQGGARGLIRPSGYRGHEAGANSKGEKGGGGRSGLLRPQCLVRPSVQGSSSSSNAGAVPSSGIPRPQGLRAPGSRIPAPRSKAPVRKTQDWMDGCY